jgi:hypothetical protein
MQTDKCDLLIMHSLYTFCRTNTQKSMFFKVFLFTFGLLFFFMCRVRSLPRCLQLATFPVSMMVMVSTSGPHVQRKMIRTAHLSSSVMVWPGHCHLPETCVIIIHRVDVESLSSHVFHSWTCFMIHILEWQLYSSAWCDGWSGLSLCRINILEECLKLLCAYVKNILYYTSSNLIHMVLLNYM